MFFNVFLYPSLPLLIADLDVLNQDVTLTYPCGSVETMSVDAFCLVVLNAEGRPYFLSEESKFFQDIDEMDQLLTQTKRNQITFGITYLVSARLVPALNIMGQYDSAGYFDAFESLQEKPQTGVSFFDQGTPQTKIKLLDYILNLDVDPFTVGGSKKITRLATTLTIYARMHASGD